MQYVLFDVETTGLSKYDEVIQFCCFIMDVNSANYAGRFAKTPCYAWEVA